MPAATQTRPAEGPGVEGPRLVAAEAARRAAGGRARGRWDWLQRGWRRFCGALGGTCNFWAAAGARFWHDGLFSKAGSLAFQTALALVPLFTVVLSVLAAFPGFRDTVLGVEEWLLSVVAPHSLEAVQGAVEGLLERTAKATAIGALSLAALALMLLHTVGDTFDSIFRIARPRPLAQRFMAYWTFLTLGPLLFAVALSLSGQLFAESDALLGGLLSWPLALAKALLPFAIELTGFVLAYWLMPGVQPRFADALAGGLVAAVLFQILKAGFAFWLVNFATYDTIYGALAAIPITLLWLELAWAVALFGAVVAALKADRRLARAQEQAAAEAANDLARVAPGARGGT